MLRLVSCLCFLALFMGISGARAEEPWRVLDMTNEGSTSDCIGDPKTPLCAVETVSACFNRGEWNLCRRVGFLGKDYDRWVPTDYARLHYYRYRVVGEGVIRQSDIPPARKSLDGLPVRAGDLALLMKWQGVPSHRPMCDGHNQSPNQILR